MKALQLSRFGGPDALEVVELPTPAPGPGQVLVRVRAAGINFFEALMLEDRYAVTPQLPAHLGVEVAGVVEALGAGVTTASVGERVAVPLFATDRPYGGYAEYVAVDAVSVVPLPDGLSFEAAVALLVQGLTALHLVRGTPPEGKAVLITAAAGGVGSLLVQMARRAGARLVIATAGSSAKLELARSLGADLAIDYTAPDWPFEVREATGNIGVDVIYDLVGGALTRANLSVLAPGGELVFGALGRFELEEADVEAAFALNQSLRGFGLLPLLEPSELGADLAGLFAQAAEGELRVTVGGTFPFGNAADAHRALRDRQTIGKIALTP